MGGFLLSSPRRHFHRIYRCMMMGSAQRSGKGTKGTLTIMPSSTTRLSYISSSSLLFHLLLLFSSSSSSFSSLSFYFSSLYSSFSTSFRKFGRRPGSPSSPARTCRKGTGMSAYRSSLLLPPRFQNNYRFRMIHRLQDIDRFHR